MKALAALFRFYINASIHVAVAVTLLVGVTVLELQIEAPKMLFFLVFFGTISGYNFVKYAKVAGLHHRSLTQNLRAIQVFSMVCGILLIFTLFYVQLKVLLVLFVFGLFTFFYAVPVYRKKNLRTFSGIKILIVALVWSGTTVVAPVFSDGMPLITDFWIVFVQRFLIVFVLTIPFEIRDLQYDTLLLKTVPQRFGIVKAKILGVIMLVGVLLLEGFKDSTSVQQLYALVGVVVLCGISLGMSQKKQSEYFASFWVESIPIVWFCTVLLFRHFLA